MKNELLMAMALVVGFAVAVHADTPMESENYAITTSVISGGGMVMESPSYRMDSTLGQPSPLMDPEVPPGSDHYWLDPGFWYTLAAGLPTCDLGSFADCFGSILGDENFSDYCDFDDDFDVDGSDLTLF